MPYEVQIEDVEPQPIGAIKKHTTLNEFGDSIGAGFGELVGALAGQGMSASGAPLVVYHTIIDADTGGDIEICLPVDAAVTAVGDVYGRDLEGGTMATTVHNGPYQDIGSAYQALMAWIPEHGHEIAGPPREIYLNDPQTVPPAQLLTRVEFPISVARG